VLERVRDQEARRTSGLRAMVAASASDGALSMSCK
jgi:uncharacterized membrane protein YebE (DUF533 family)